MATADDRDLSPAMAAAKDRGKATVPSSGIGTMDTSTDGGQFITPISNRVQNESKVTDAKGTTGSTKKQRDDSSEQTASFHLIHSPTRFERVVSDLSQEQRDVVKDMGFGGLLLMPKMSIRKVMLVDVAKKYQVRNQSFRICDQDITIYPEDVREIMALQIEGADVEEYVKTTKKSEDKTLETELYKRYADTNGKLELRKLEDMIRASKTPDDDFRRAFVLFTIGVILAPNTVDHVNYSYIQVVEHVSLIKNFNWGQFTLAHLLDSCESYITRKEATLKGNLTLLQCWYWERVLIEDSTYGVKYDKTIKPRMLLWTEKNSNARMNVFIKKGVDFGTLILPHVCLSTHQKMERPEASMSQVRQSKYANEEYVTNSPVRQEGLSNQKMESLEEWKDDIETHIGLHVEKKTHDMEYKLGTKILAQNEEIANLKKEMRLVRKIEAENAQMKLEIKELRKLVPEISQMKNEIKELRQLVQLLIPPTHTTAHAEPVMPTSGKVQAPMPTLANAQPSSMTTSSHMQESPRERFRHSFARIKDEAPTATNGTTENIMQQQGGPTTNITRGKHTVGNPSAHMKPRQPIVDNDYNLEQIDEDAAMFLLSSYDHATVVNIDGHVLTAEQLRRNVTGAFIADEVINTFVHFSNVDTESASYITTFQAHKLAKNILGLDGRSKFRKEIAEKCKGRHLVFVPMHINGNHWAVLVLNFIKTEVQILNSITNMRDKDLEKALVEGIQSCIEYSDERELVENLKSVNLREWEIVPYDNIPQQTDCVSCGAYVIKYILAWDGDHLADHFTPKEIKSFRLRICTRLLRSERNLEYLPSIGKPITEQEYIAKHPEERGGHERNEDAEDVQILSPSTGTPTIAAASMKESNGRKGGEANKQSGEREEKTEKRGRGRPRKKGVEGNTTSGGREENTALAAESKKRPRGRPRKNVNTPIVILESTESLNKRPKREGRFDGSFTEFLE